MRPVFLLAAALALAACDSGGYATPDSADALASKSPPPHTTGGATVVRDDLEVQINVQAHEGEPDWGSLRVEDSHGRSFTADVTCYHQIGNEAGISGVITGGTMPAGMYVRFDVQDNGQGRSSPPDRVRLRVKRAPQDCSPISSSFPGRLTRGNLQVH